MMDAATEAIRRLRHHLNRDGFVKSGHAHFCKPGDGGDMVAIPRWSLLQIIDLLEGKWPEERKETEAEKREEFWRDLEEAEMPGGFP